MLHAPWQLSLLKPNKFRKRRQHFVAISCLAMDIDHWCSGYDRINISLNGMVSGSKTPRWRVLWRKIMKERKRIFDCSSSSCTRVHEPYDPLSYSRNFDDQGLMWADPDNVSRSFSARFAVPSRVFQNSGGFQLV